MVRYCIVKCCVNSNQRTKGQEKVHLFPVAESSSETRRKWFAELGIPSTRTVTYTGVCAVHFKESDYENSRRSKPKLKLQAIPSLNIKEPNYSDERVESEGDSAVVHLPLETSTKYNESTTISQLNFACSPHPCYSPDRSDIIETFEPGQAHMELCTIRLKLKSAQLKIKAQAQRIKYQNTRIHSLTSRVCLLRLRRKKQNTNALNSTDQRIATKIHELFSPGQIQILLGTKKYKHWTAIEMSKAIALNSLSTKAYGFVRDKYKLPLPSHRSIQRWLKNLVLEPGILSPIFDILAQVANSTPMHSKAVLAFDEVEIDDRYCYDEGEDRVYGGKSKMLEVCLRGLFAQWKQVVFYDFEENIQSDKILSIIEKAESVGVNVVAMVHDMSTSNVRLWKQLDVSVSKVSPLKLLRNHLLDSYFTLVDGTRIDRGVLDKLLELDDEDFKICFRLTSKHVNVEKKERQRVRPAFQIFSNSVSKAISYLELAPAQVSDFFQLVNDFSDIFNSGHIGNDSNVFKLPFGTHFAEQEAVLIRMRETIRTMTVGEPPKTRKQALKPFQKGLIISINSLLGLYEEMRQPPLNINYILTRRLGQDYVESSFSSFRSIGGTNSKPNAVESKSRIKRICVTWNFAPSRNENVERVETEGFLSSNFMEQLCSQRPAIPKCQDLPHDFPDMSYVRSEPTLFPSNLYSRKSKCLEGGREFVAGRIAKKFRKQHPKLSLHWTKRCPENCGWLRHLSNGGLTEPSTLWLHTFRAFDEYFLTFHSTSVKVNKEPGVVKVLQTLIEQDFPEVPSEAVKFFCKARTMFRISNINESVIREKIRIRKLRRAEWRESEAHANSNTETEAEQMELDENVELAADTI